MIECLKLCRPLHWIKNVLVFLPPFFLSVIFREDIFKLLLPGFLAFSFVATSIYILNDIFDRSYDRSHPERKNRPIANGKVKLSVAWMMAVGFALSGMGLTFFAKVPLYSIIAILLYLVMNIGYSLGLKHVPVLDVFLLASGFVFRIFFGGFYFDIPISSWLFLCVFSVALYFAFGKRKSEFKKYGVESRPVLAKYNKIFLTAHYYLFCVLSVLFYCLWTITRTGQNAVGKFALTIPFMIFIVARYNLIVETSEEYADPVPTLLRDKWLLTATLFFILTNFIFLYFRV
jgi:4-hydroxybenzoate polyprenyltransferase